MGKVKSAIITMFLVAAIIVMTLFATVSCNINGDVNRYNSFISSIRLSSEFTGEAYVMLYPDGVLSTEGFKLKSPVHPEEATEEKQTEFEEKYNEYISKYELRGGVYVEKEKLGYVLDEDSGEYVLDEDASAIEQEFKDSIAKDAEILSKRFGEKGYTSYSVSIEDGYSIRVSVPTGFTYSAYKNYNTDVQQDAITEISHTIEYLMLDGELSLRDGNDYDSSSSVIAVKDDISSYFKRIGTYSMGGNHALKLVLNSDGFNKLSARLEAKDSGTAYFFVGKTPINLTVTMGEALSDKTMYYQLDAAYAQDYAILLRSAIAGDTLANAYNTDSASSSSPIPITSTYGRYSAVYLLVAMLLVIAGAVVLSCVKYKKLGFVQALMTIIYALVIVCALMLLNIQLSIAGAFTAALGLALLTFTNFRVFEAVRKETSVGRTISAAVKLGYRKTLAGILDLHIILVVAAAMLTLIGAGEVAACGFIFFIATIASYVLYWFTRLMWYVISSPVRDKFKFCGFAREDDDED